MEPAERKVLRLLGVLDVLYDQEAAEIRAGNADGLLRIQSRTSAVIEGIRSAPEGATSGDVRRRAEQVMAKRASNRALISEAVSRLEGEMTRVQNGRRRLSVVAPVYKLATGEGASKRLSALV